LTPQLVGLCQIVRGVDVEKGELRVGQSPYLPEREDTDPNAIVEADSAKVTRVEAVGDGFSAGRSVGCTEWLDTPPPPALRQHSIMVIEPISESADQWFGDKGHVPRNAHDRCRALQNCGVDTPQRAQPWSNVADCPEIRPPGTRIGRVRDEQWLLSQCRDHDSYQAVQDALTTDQLEPLGFALKPGCSTAGEDDASHG
jgi:hypothetical protein